MYTSFSAPDKFYWLYRTIIGLQAPHNLRVWSLFLSLKQISCHSKCENASLGKRERESWRKGRKKKYLTEGIKQAKKGVWKVCLPLWLLLSSQYCGCCQISQKPQHGHLIGCDQSYAGECHLRFRSFRNDTTSPWDLRPAKKSEKTDDEQWKLSSRLSVFDIKNRIFPRFAYFDDLGLRGFLLHGRQNVIVSLSCNSIKNRST